ncbi:ribonuclease P protein component [Solihabitans fulvus]|uniref:Ribonuclease P protein component n=1 Tax=Solihabitans fulvus TaxID=1892852 RepID=A0A5B2XKX0_9PSEU|nr:ribonuclease P protein component [Solihabitans fulvus]KAA2263754.1 ribonuclease P protein component [Solihabitans fulvus]
MLPAAARLTHSQDFGLVVRRGRRAGRPRLVLHALTSSALEQSASSRQHDTRGTPTLTGSQPAKVGFVVSKAVGNSVVRHRVARRLRHLVRDRIGVLPAGSALVIRALPPSAEASSADLGVDLDAALRRLKLGSTSGSGGAE